MKVDTGLIEINIAVNRNRPLANSGMMSTLTVHCQWEDETVRQRTSHPLSYTKAKKIKLLTPHTHGCPRASLRNCSSFSSFSV